MSFVPVRLRPVGSSPDADSGRYILNTDRIPALALRNEEWRILLPERDGSYQVMVVHPEDRYMLSGALGLESQDLWTEAERARFESEHMVDE